jgi:hypothetical protein
LARLTAPAATRVIGAICFLLALATTLPIVHVAPAAVILLFGLALIYRDGVLVIAAAVGAVVSVVLGVLLINSGVVALNYLAAAWLNR